MPRRKTLNNSTVQDYPLKVPNLSQADLQALIEVLAIEPPQPAPPLYGENTKQQIQEAVNKLPPALRKRPLIFSSSTSIPAATLCVTHKRLNQYIIGHIFRLIQREVEDHLDIITQRYPGYPESLESQVVHIVRNLQSLRGLWWDLTSSRSPPIDPIPFQQNKCEACMVSRIIASPGALQDLRAALLSRTRERCSYRLPPKLTRFIDGALYYRHGKSLLPLIQYSTKFSSDLKRARKEAARCTSRQHSRRCDGTKCKPRLPSRIVPDHQRISKPPEEPSGPALTSLSPNFDPDRRESSQTMKFWLVPETVSSFELEEKLKEDQEDEEQRKTQDLLIQEILNAYGPFRTSMEVAASLNRDSQYLSDISTTQGYDINSTNYTARKSLSELSDWEDDWDDRSITINSGSPAVDQLVTQIGSLLLDEAGGNDLDSTQSSRGIGIVALPTPHETTVGGYSEKGTKWSSWHDSGEESDAKAAADPTKNSETTARGVVLAEE
ncbi:hypothetical protein BDW67DRAFT_191441 [Aspergillus spinulosporus]